MGSRRPPGLWAEVIGKNWDFSILSILSYSLLGRLAWGTVHFQAHSPGYWEDLPLEARGAEGHLLAGRQPEASLSRLPRGPPHREAWSTAWASPGASEQEGPRDDGVTVS